MRIATSQIHQSAVTAMLEQQTQLNHTQQQLSTGKRMLTPADDPAAAARILSLNQSIDTTEQYQRNTDGARSRLTLEESTLSGAGDILQRVRELAVQGNNGSRSAADRSAIAAEVRQLSSQLQGLANTKDASGDYMFAGFQANTQPFTDNGGGTIVYNGDQGVKQVQIGPQRFVEVGDSGASVFMNLPASGGGQQDIFSTLNNFAAAMEANVPSSATITDIDAGLDSILTTRAKIGARLNALDSQTDINSGYVVQLKSALSSVEDLDYADAISRFNQQMQALQAAQSSYAKVQGLSLFNYLR